MIVLNPTTKDKVYLAWLKSELYRKLLELTSEEIALIENPDLENELENNKRENLLLHKYGRSAILDKLPSDLEWSEVEVEDHDLDKIFILPVLDWFMDTGKTFQLKNVPLNLSPSRGHRIATFPQMPTTHHQKIQEMLSSPDLAKGDIIIISSSNDGPFTIIDGTHRSSVLQIRNSLPTTKGFLGVKDDLTNCFWSIERATIQNDLQEMNQLADQQIIW